jgi:hypothetical protein
MTFGIPTQVLPISDQCEYNFEHVQLFFDSRIKVEGYSSSSPTTITTTSSSSSSQPESNNNNIVLIMVPGSLDVLMGRDKMAQTHIGNVKYLHLIETHMERYESAERRDKKKIACEVTNLVQQSGGRFLDCSEDATTGTSDQCWYEVQDAIAVEKACTAFRSRRKVAKRATQTATQQAVVVVPKQKRREDDDSIALLSPIDSSKWTTTRSSFLEKNQEEMSGHITDIGHADFKRNKVETMLLEDDWIYSDAIESSELQLGKPRT